MKRLAILGGTFNPIHLGHLILADTALTQCHLDQVLWLPSRYAHYKPFDQILEFPHRVQLIQRAIAHQPQFVLPTIQQDVQGVSYALDLFQQLQAAYPGVLWHWIMGLDALRSLPQWYGRQILVEQCTWLIAPRIDLNSLCVQDFTSTDLPLTTSLEAWILNETEVAIQAVADRLRQEGLEFKGRSLQMPLIPISSRLIRARCRQRQSIRHLVPDGVYDDIAAHHWYAHS
ncbi:MAG: nicotinate (nicotinamide) nucleotide adenylyltransferase [Synechococcales cyanobacterium T60_A2020_003]|nr:nicotinate (nicotinamide) nucleotide adenylyltransferase [Synechococcales cyanobacterium T60_A2020_003]